MSIMLLANNVRLSRKERLNAIKTYAVNMGFKVTRIRKLTKREVERIKQ